jgi:hypothetical protein
MQRLTRGSLGVSQSSSYTRQRSLSHAPLLRRVASLVPPPRANLTRFHGVFAPGAKLRPFLVPQAGEEEARAGKEAAGRTERMKQRTPRVDFCRVAEEDVRLRRVGLREVWRQAPGVGGP